MSESFPTAQPENSPADPDVTKPSRRKRWLRRIAVWALPIVVIGALVFNTLVTLPYVSLSPGEVISAESYLTTPQEYTQKPSSEVGFLTVSMREGKPLSLLWALVSEGTEIERTHNVRGDQSAKDYLDYSNREMLSSQQVATFVALKRSGFKAEYTGTGAVVVGVAKDAPASDVLGVEDVITSINGTPIRTSVELVEMVRSMQVGASMSLEVETNGVKRMVALQPAARPEGLPGTGPYIGVLAATRESDFQTEFPVQFKDSEVSGPSAGLAFTVALIDQITPGELTGGKKVALTGTVDITGEVGEVGGIMQKTVAANRDKVELLLVPADEVDDAKKHARKGMKVVGVRTVDEALQAIRDAGGDLSGLDALARGEHTKAA